MNNATAWKKGLNIIKKHRFSTVQDEHALIFLISFLSKISINKIYLRWKQPISFDFEQLVGLVDRYIKGEPLAYLTNEVEFVEHTFFIDERAFIPRIETAELTIRTIDLIKEYFPNKQNLTIIDIGTGSGAIAITLALAFPEATVYASDISPTALAVGEINKLKHQALNVHFLVGDFLKPFIKQDIKADVIIANPPYIAKNDPDLDVSVRDYEPDIALYSGSDGLWFYQHLFENWQQILKPGGLISLEIGYKQQDALITIAKNYFLQQSIRFGRDRFDLWRFMFIKT